MTDTLKLADFFLCFFLISLWFGDFFARQNVGKTSTYISELLKKDAQGLKLALANAPNLSTEARALTEKKVRVINRWYFLANKTGTMLAILALQKALVIYAKQNWGLVAIDISILVICGLILAADLRVNIVRNQLEKALKPYEDRLWFEYRLRS